MASTAVSTERPTSPPRPRWRQFSLRTLLLAMLVVSVGLALFAWRLQRARRQAAAVATIRELGGSVFYDYQYDSRKGGGKAKAESSVPGWLIKWLGEDFFHEVVGATIDGPQPKSDDEVRAFWLAVRELHELELFQASHKWVDGRRATETVGRHYRLKSLHLTCGNLRGSDLAPLAELSNLESLALYSNPIGDDAAEHLGNFPKLMNVFLFFTDVGDETASKLAQNKRLVTIELNKSQVTDVGVERLAKLPDLEVLRLSGTHVTDRGLAKLAPLANLQTLDIMQTEITGIGFRELQGLSKLEALLLLETPLTDDGAKAALILPGLRDVDLAGTKLTMASLGEVEWPASLEHVRFSGTGLTDDGLMRLAKCPNLTSVGVSGTKVTPEGIKRFQQARPGVNVH